MARAGAEKGLRGRARAAPHPLLRLLLLLLRRPRCRRRHRLPPPPPALVRHCRRASSRPGRRPTRPSIGPARRHSSAATEPAPLLLADSLFFFFFAVFPPGSARCPDRTPPRPRCQLIQRPTANGSRRCHSPVAIGISRPLRRADAFIGSKSRRSERNCLGQVIQVQVEEGRARPAPNFVYDWLALGRPMLSLAKASAHHPGVPSSILFLSDSGGQNLRANQEGKR